jgi:hypothetical protein
MILGLWFSQIDGATLNLRKTCIDSGRKYGQTSCTAIDHGLWVG